MISISNTTRRKAPLSSAFLSKTVDRILGKKYDLSLVFVGKRRSQNLNMEYRGKDYPANVLSFPLDDENGEIFISLDSLEKGSKEFEMSQKKYLTYLFIHGCLHLKGYDHGKKMDELEQKYLKNI